MMSLPARPSVFGALPAALLIVLSLCIGGCAIPRAGPGPGDFPDSPEKTEPAIPLSIVRADRQIIEKLKAVSIDTLASLGADKPISDTIGIGDVLSIQIYEPGSNGLFGAGAGGGSGSSGSSVGQFPRLVLSRDGEITVPFAGSLKVVGMTPTEVQKEIEKNLQGKAIQPQAVVSVVQNVSNTATIGGDIKLPGRAPLSLAGERVRDVINLAGGPMHEPQDVLLQLTRGTQTKTVQLQSVIDSLEENAYVFPGDQIQLTYRPRSVTVFGAALRPSEIPLQQASVNLAQTLARAGGLSDDKADPSAVFVFRFENAEALGALADAAARMPNGTVPIIYQVDLSEPQGFFIAKGMEMRDGDMLYVSNTRSVNAAKVGALIRQFTGVAFDLRGATSLGN